MYYRNDINLLSLRRSLLLTSNEVCYVNFPSLSRRRNFTYQIKTGSSSFSLEPSLITLQSIPASEIWHMPRPLSPLCNFAIGRIKWHTMLMATISSIVPCFTSFSPDWIRGDLKYCHELFFLVECYCVNEILCLGNIFSLVKYYIIPLFIMLYVCHSTLLLQLQEAVSARPIN